mgnify:CR=1 FL=1
MPQIREQIAMVHLPPSKTLKYLFHVRKTKEKRTATAVRFSFYRFHLRYVNELNTVPQSHKTQIFH